MLFTTLFVLAPLVCIRHLDSLELSSAISVGLAVVFVVVTAAIFMYKLAFGTVSTPQLFPTFSADASAILGLFSVVPVLVTAFICHHTIHPVLNEMRNESDHKKVVQFSISLCTALYVMTSAFGYLLFGEDTLSDILSNFDADLGVPYGTVLSDIVRVGYALHLMLVYPVLNFSLRLNVDELVFPRAVPLTYDNRRFYLVTCCLTSAAFLGASFIPDIWDAFQFTGSTSAVCLGFVFPGAVVLRNRRHIFEGRGKKLLAWFLILLAAGASIMAITGDIYELFE
ncbi:hypothetical protein KP509_12G054700 [Ceratopteris richardii]|nr:hypothetical protein KP509_12G054700 [Ceratopteris richardii]